jgi:hypothetical protein
MKENMPLSVVVVAVPVVTATMVGLVCVTGRLEPRKWEDAS